MDAALQGLRDLIGLWLKDAAVEHKPYRGKLAEPIQPPDLLTETATEAAVRMTNATVEKLVALCEHYEIAGEGSDRWFLLALALAQDHVRGFRIEAAKSPGKPTSADQVVSDLVLFVELVKAKEAGKSIQNAARQLVKTRGRFHGRNADTLRQRYYLLKKPDTPEGSRMRAFLFLQNVRDHANKPVR